MIVTSTAYAAIDTRHRIKDPNSQPRQIRIIGLGVKGGSDVVQLDVARFPHVKVTGVSGHWDGAVDAAELLASITTANGMTVVDWLKDADQIFMVAGDGDDVSLAPAIKQLARRANVSITGILRLAPSGGDVKTLEILRGATDMLIVTSFDDYVVGMLEELGA
jgi:hypothetical protein